MNNGGVAEFTTGFWSGWVVLLVVLGLVFVAALVWTSARGGVRAEAEVWDETLREGDAEPPKWWYFLFIAVLVFSCVYLVLYPGLGGWRGVLNWTQFGQYKQAEAYYEEQYGEERRRWAEAPFAELAADDSAMQTAARLFADNCAACHGRDGRGQADMFPDLTDGVWQWGGGEEAVYESVLSGRLAAMPSQAAVLGGESASAAAADYVRTLSGLSEPAEGHEKAAAQFMQVCAACHGADGKGNPELGAPDLTDGVWLYGNSRGAILHSITHGRAGEMPAQGKRLGKARSRLLAAWLASGKINDFPPK